MPSGRLVHLRRLIVEVLEYARANRKWWLVPLVLVLLLFGFLVAVGSAVAPYLYPMF